MLVSPGALDMSGLVITPRQQDFENLTAEKTEEIMAECSMEVEDMRRMAEVLKCPYTIPQPASTISEKPTVTVGIVSGEHIRFSLNKPYLAKGVEMVGEQEVESRYRGHIKIDLMNGLIFLFLNIYSPYNPPGRL